MSLNGRAKQRGKKLDADCSKAQTCAHAFGANDTRVFCEGLYNPAYDQRIDPECEMCGAFIENAEPLASETIGVN